MANVPISNPGFETGSFSGWTVQNVAEASVVTTPVNSGGFAGHFTDAGVDSGGALVQTLPSSYTSGILYSRCYFRYHNLSALGDYPIMVLGTNSAGPSGINARIDVPSTINVGRLAMYNSVQSTFGPGDGSVNMAVDTWYRMELAVTIAVVGNAELRLYSAAGILLDTLVWAGTNTAATYQAIGMMNTGGGQGAGPRTFDIYIDDIAVNDSTWPGPIPSGLVDDIYVADDGAFQWGGTDGMGD